MRWMGGLVGLAVLGLFAPAAGRAAPPAVEKYLLEGKTADAVKDLSAHLKANPGDDQARFGLGVAQFLQAFEHVGQSLYKYGLRTERTFGPRVAPALGMLLPQNPNPEKISYANVRQVLQTWVDDLNRAESALAQIKDADVKLPLHMALIKLDLSGLGKPVNAAALFNRLGMDVPKEQVEKFVIKFDRGDVSWLRGYCHFLAGWGELLLAVDAQELFDCTAHLFFERVDSPYPFLQENRKAVGQGFPETALISDAIAFIHLLRLPMKEPARCKVALEHFESTLAQAREMWKYILAETGDDNEWIPNPKQKGVLGVKVTKEMIDTWLETVTEAEAVLQGKRLLPFWRGNQVGVGVNLRKAFTEPRTFDPLLWFQGTAAGPYLEKGPLTKFTTPQLLNRINGNFGGYRFMGFAFWFN